MLIPHPRYLLDYGATAPALAEAMMELVRAGEIDAIPAREAPLSSANEVLDELKAGRVIGRVVLVP